MVTKWGPTARKGKISCQERERRIKEKERGGYPRKDYWGRKGHSSRSFESWTRSTRPRRVNKRKNQGKLGWCRWWGSKMDPCSKRPWGPSIHFRKYTYKGESPFSWVGICAIHSIKVVWGCIPRSCTVWSQKKVNHVEDREDSKDRKPNPSHHNDRKDSSEKCGR